MLVFQSLVNFSLTHDPATKKANVDNRTAVNVSKALVEATSNAGQLTARDLKNTVMVITKVADTLPTLDAEGITEVSIGVSGA